MLSESNLALSDSLFGAIKEKQLSYERTELYSFENTYYLASNNKFTDADSGLVYLHVVDDMSRLFWLNLIIVYVVTIAFFLLYRIKFSDTQVSSKIKVVTLFKRGHRRIKMPKSEHLLEFVIVSMLIVVMSKGSFDKQLTIFYSSKILPVASNHSFNIDSSLALITPSYVGVNGDFSSTLSANNLKSGINTISATIVYDKEALLFEGANILTDICDEVYDNNIDQVQGIIHFSCVTKDFTSDIPGSSRLAEFQIKSLKQGLTYIAFDAAYVKITTGHGISNQIEQSTDKGEGIWVLDSI